MNWKRCERKLLWAIWGKIKIVKRRKYAKYSYQKLKLFLRNRIFLPSIQRAICKSIPKWMKCKNVSKFSTLLQEKILTAHTYSCD
jgi:hypothetical protein